MTSGSPDPIAYLFTHFALSFPRPPPLLTFLLTTLVGVGSFPSPSASFSWSATVWAVHGLPRISGHCFRISRTTELFIYNMPLHIVKVMRRWSSDSFLRVY
ncbi:hypothetical protein F4604DRAFT_1565792 [Suillus subluteus]|nr:hypothetical protein F4604DRAFT_1565792 [Suillus subluteus]